jgi:hypothetical protein
MNKTADNVLAACMIELEIKRLREAGLIEANTSTAPWADVDKTKLPASCFLWVDDPKKKSTWHLPYREGEGGINPDTGMYRQAGPININALRAVSQAIGGARTGTSMNLPAEIKAKINRLLKKYKIGEYAKQEGKKMKIKFRDFTESIFSENGVQHDKENCIVRGVAILKESSQNCSYKKGKGRKYTERALQSTAQLITGAKSYINHATRQELEERGGIRDVRDLLGYFENGRIDGGIVRADLHYLESHKKWFSPIVDKMSDKVGNSIHAYGPSSFNEDTLFETVQDIKVLRSADLVTEPGSTSNLFESLRRDNDKDMDMTTITINDLKESRPDLIQTIVGQYKESEDAKNIIKGKDDTIQKLEEENKTLKESLDKYKVKEALAKKEKLIEEKLKKSELPKEAITEIFKNQLLEAKDDSVIDGLIKDRKDFIKSSSVKGMGDETDPEKGFNYTEARKDYAKAIEGVKIE